MTGWSFDELKYGGGFKYVGVLNEQKGTNIEEGLKQLKAEPEKWSGLHFQSNMRNWPKHKQKWILFGRESEVKPARPGQGSFTFVTPSYKALQPATFTDKVSSGSEMTRYGPNALHWKRPGRGEGIADMPGLKLFGDVDPDDIRQGAVGDCWLVSAISALAEFQGEVKDLFSEAELSPEGKYTIKLYDLPSKQFKDITIDDRLACTDHGLLSLKVTADVELWPLLLEKAMVAHGGGWDKINGGQSSMALVALTGCTETFTVINKNGKGQTPSYRKLTPNWDTYEENNCHCPASRSSPVGRWPNGEERIGPDELFDLLCEWDEKNYVVCAGTGAGSDSNTTDGIVDGHAYSLIAAKKQVCGKVDLLLFRNPHGKTEFTGGWSDGGREWQENPDVKAALGHKEDPDDGLFWMSRVDAFKYFHTFYVCCKSMDKGKKPKHPPKSEATRKRRRRHRKRDRDILIEQEEPDQQEEPEPSDDASAPTPLVPAVPPAPPAATNPGAAPTGGAGAPQDEGLSGGCADACKACSIS